MLEELKELVCDANRRLPVSGLVTLTWGNVSGYDRNKDLMVIKPSGVPYEKLTAKDMVVVDQMGVIAEGKLSPSSDTPTHLLLYRHFPHIGGIVHSHSLYATMFAQACREIPCLGTTHADHFCGTVPVARALTRGEVIEAYEGNTGKVIVERFKNLDAVAIPGVLVAHHAPFTWGPNPFAALENSIALEAIARMAYGTLSLNPEISHIPPHILQKHYTRKHGPDATYGQKTARSAGKRRA